MPLPKALQDIVDEFASAPTDLRVELLFEYSEKLPPLPSELVADGHRAMEQVTECQSPFFLTAEVRDDDTVQLWFDCPPEAPTTRGFAGVLAEGLQGATAGEILDVPEDFYTAMGLGEAISLLRLRGMSAILHRLKRQVLAQRVAAS